MTGFVDPLEEPLVQERGIPVDTGADDELEADEKLGLEDNEKLAEAAGEDRGDGVVDPDEGAP